ncbi:GGDEF domain-containing protein [Janthinobacterium sp. RA13]|uniref:GGDEF domain-containing protein n=1 Tax=Janthinobacterium sp. RA13 TaxID=1502762 RepID=UPI0009DFB010|nr:GGDEF domain-containing protein [Janthinobacterium sp. RA13]
MSFNDTQLKYFSKEIYKIKEMDNCNMYIQKNENWICIENSETISDDELLKAMNEKSKNNFQKKQTGNGNWIAIFWVEKYEISLIVNIEPKKHKSTLIELLKKINQSFESSKLIYYANHDTLTGLLNRNGTQAKLDNYFHSLKNSDNKSEDGEQKFSLIESIAIFSFDIDNFKQVNDSYGHEAGDAILTIISKRLENAINNLESKMNSKFILSRPGGEEFELIAIEDLTRDTLEEISKCIFNEIRKPSLPTEQEINHYQDKIEIYLHKGISDLKISVSIGVSKEPLPEKDSETIKFISKLRKKADLALSRAKNDGKDCVRFFEDISQKHGKVIEFYPESNLAIIDIGKSVNVSNGDIYSVYYPPFTGKNVCVKDDGRSRKTLGNYIALESAKIQIIDVQEHISTCIIIDKNTLENIPIESTLKKINVGTKPYLPTTRHLIIDNEKTENLIKTIENLIKDENLLAVINLLPQITEEDFSKKNNLLSKYKSIISMVLPSKAEIFSSMDNSIFLILRNYKSSPISNDTLIKNDKEEISLKQKKYLEKLLRKINDLFNFSAGIYLASNHPKNSEKTAEICLHLSKASLHVAINNASKNNIAYFNGYETILTWRRKNNTKDAISDYSSFKKYGISDASMENQIGLSILTNNELENFDIAELAFSISNESTPKNEIFFANLGMLKAHRKKFNEAFELLKNIKSIESYTSPYCISFAKSAIECNKNGAEIDKNMILNLINIATGKETKRTVPSTYHQWLEELKKYKKENFPD